MIIALSLTTTPRADAASGVSFSRDIAPILVQKCLTCHSKEKAKGGYTLHTFKAMLTPGESKAASIVAGKPRESRLHQLIVSQDEDERMPQRSEPLTPEQIRLFERWIEEGAKSDAATPETELTSIIPAAHLPAPERYVRPVPVTAVALHPDGRELAAAGYHEITVWETLSGRLLARIGNVARQTHALAYSPDGKLLAAASGTPGLVGEVKLFDAQTRVELTTLDRAGDSMLDVAFTPDGTRLAAAGADSLVRVYDVATRSRELLSQQHADWVMAIAFTPDGKRLASASRDGTVRVIDARGGDILATYPDHAETPLAVAVSADGRTVFSGGRDNAVHGWQAEDAKKPVRIDGLDGDVLKLLLRKDHLFVATSDKKVRQYRATDRTPVRELPHDDWVYSLSMDQRGEQLATGSYNGEVRIYNVNDGKRITSFIAAPGFQRPSDNK